MRRIFLFALLGVSVVALLLSDLPFGFYLYQVERDRLLTQLQRDAFILGGRSEEALEHGAVAELNAARELAVIYREEGGARVIVVDDEGIAVIVNDPDDSRVGLSYASRPEIAEALAGRVSTGQRFSETLGIELVYVAVPVYSGAEVVGAVRLTFEEKAIDEAVNRQLLGVLLVALVTLIFAVGLAILLSRVLSRNLQELGATAERLSKGDLRVRAEEPPGPREIRELAQGFNLMATRLEMLVEEQKAFAADASHQLRTPLTSLKLKIERLRDLAPSSPELDSQLEQIDNELLRMRRLIEGLLALGRASAESLAVENVDLGKIAAERVSHWESLAEEQQVSLHLSGPSSALVKAVPTAVEQIIDNFIDNALSVTARGGEIEVTISRLPDGWALTVRDTGPGISAQSADRAFDRFWRGSATHEGTGLGLAIVKQLVEASGGSARLEPHPEKGAVATALFRAAD